MSEIYILHGEKDGEKMIEGKTKLDIPAFHSLLRDTLGK